MNARPKGNEKRLDRRFVNFTKIWLREYERLPVGTEPVRFPISANSARVLLCFFANREFLKKYGYSQAEIDWWKNSCTSRMECNRKLLVEAAGF